jgi:hypothetical protein
MIRPLTRVLVALVLRAGSAMTSAGSATADLITPFTQVYDRIVHGDFNIIGKHGYEVPGYAVASAMCADGAGRADPNAVNDEYRMAWADADTSAATFNSSSATLTIPPGATVDHVRLHWARNTGPHTDASGLVISPLCGGNTLVAGRLAILLPGALTGIVLNDAAEPGCAAAAGSFNVAVGESKSFYCTTTNVTESVTNTVTATRPLKNPLVGAFPICRVPCRGHQIDQAFCRSALFLA